MANQDGFPKCEVCGKAMRVIAGDHPTVCKNCAPPRAEQPKVRGVAPHTHKGDGVDSPPAGAPSKPARKRSRR